MAGLAWLAILLHTRCDFEHFCHISFCNDENGVIVDLDVPSERVPEASSSHMSIEERLLVALSESQVTIAEPAEKQQGGCSNKPFFISPSLDLSIDAGARSSDDSKAS